MDTHKVCRVKPCSHLAQRHMHQQAFTRYVHGGVVVISLHTHDLCDVHSQKPTEMTHKEALQISVAHNTLDPIMQPLRGSIALSALTHTLHRQGKSLR